MQVGPYETECKASAKTLHDKWFPIPEKKPVVVPKRTVRATNRGAKRRLTHEKFKGAAVRALASRGVSVEDIADELRLCQLEVSDLINVKSLPVWGRVSDARKANIICERLEQGQSMRSIATAFRGATESTVIWFTRQHLNVIWDAARASEEGGAV